MQNSTGITVIYLEYNVEAIQCIGNYTNAIATYKLLEDYIL